MQLITPVTKMETTHKLLLFSSSSLLLLLLLLLSAGVELASAHSSHRHLFNFRPSTLFVFGDSYADTGNVPKIVASSWKHPYGVIFPGKPAGRFSDGRVWTDFVARFIGVKSPIPYRWRKYAVNHLKYGMNFAFGGTGVFDTLAAPLPNMTTQIDLFQQVIAEKVYSTADLQSSVALVSVAGNDYSTYLALDGTAQGFPPLITKLVSQLAVDLKRIQQLGVKKVAVGALEPVGCLPGSTFTSSFQKCNDTLNQLVIFHNQLLQQAVAKLNNETKDSTFVILDLYSAFNTVLQDKGQQHPGSTRFQNPLKPCCLGFTTSDSCGSVDVNGTKQYSVCEDPESAFFWDTVHPTQAGWRAVYFALQSSLGKQLFIY